MLTIYEIHYIPEGQSDYVFCAQRNTEKAANRFYDALKRMKLKCKIVAISRGT